MPVMLECKIKGAQLQDLKLLRADGKCWSGQQETPLHVRPSFIALTCFP